jgi:hypothetical protein
MYLVFGITKTGSAHPEQCKQGGRIDKNVNKYGYGKDETNLLENKQKDRDLQELQRTKKGKKVAPVVRPRRDVIQEFQHGSTWSLEKCNSCICVFMFLQFLCFYGFISYWYA